MNVTHRVMFAAGATLAATYPDRLAEVRRAFDEAPGEITVPVSKLHRQVVLVARGDEARKYKSVDKPMPLYGRTGEAIGLVTAIERRTGPGGEEVWATVETTEPIDPRAAMRFTFTEATGPKYPGEGNRRARREQAAGRRRGR